jgi:hypothetical protein
MFEKIAFPVLQKFENDNFKGEIKMTEKTFNNVRVINKHDIEANWSKASFIPKKAELIIYDMYDTDGNKVADSVRYKIGDGISDINSLAFATDSIVSSLNAQIDDVDDKVDALSVLVGNTKVSDQIAAANIIYVGPDRPTDPNIKVWINTAEEDTISVLPRLTTISLLASNWVGGSAPYSQDVEIATVTSATKIDLQPTVSQIVDLQNQDIALMAENNNGTIKVYSFGGKPSGDMTMQVLLTEVSYV